MAHIAAQISAAGVEDWVSATDGGQHVNPAPVEALRLLIQGLIDEGFDSDEIRYMTVDRSRKVLFE